MADLSGVAIAPEEMTANRHKKGIPKAESLFYRQLPLSGTN